MTWRIFYIALVGLVLAGIVHIAIIFLIPQYSTKDAWAFLSSRTDQFTFTRLNARDNNSAIAETDPYFAYGVCRFDLNETGAIVKGNETQSYWSASVFDEDGSVVYSLNNRTAISGKPDLVIVSPVQSLELREIQPTELETSVVIEANVRLGYVIIRVLQPDMSFEGATDAFLSSIKCSRYQPDSTAS